MNTKEPAFPFTIRAWPSWAQCVLACGLIALALSGQKLLGSSPAGPPPYLTLFIVLLPLVVLIRPAPFLATAFSGLFGAMILFAPQGLKFWIEGRAAWLQLGLLIAAAAAAAATAWLSDRVQRAHRADAAALARLYEVGVLCAQPTAEQWACLDAILVAAIELAGDGKGNIQVLDHNTGNLHIIAQHGFGDEFLDFFRVVRQDIATSCGEAHRTRSRVIVDDVEASPIFKGTRSLEVLRRASVGSVVSTPLVSSSGWLVGAINVHFSKPHAIDSARLKWIDILASQAADYIERKQAEVATRAKARLATAN